MPNALAASGASEANENAENGVAIGALSSVPLAAVLVPVAVVVVVAAVADGTELVSVVVVVAPAIILQSFDRTGVERKDEPAPAAAVTSAGGSVDSEFAAPKESAPNAEVALADVVSPNVSGSAVDAPPPKIEPKLKAGAESATGVGLVVVSNETSVSSAPPFDRGEISPIRRGAEVSAGAVRSD